MRIEKLDDESIKVVYESDLDIIFMKRINDEKHRLGITIKSLQRELKIQEEINHTLKEENARLKQQ